MRTSDCRVTGRHLGGLQGCALVDLLTVPDASWGSRWGGGDKVPARRGLTPWGALTHLGTEDARGEREISFQPGLPSLPAKQASGHSVSCNSKEILLLCSQEFGEVIASPLRFHVPGKEEVKVQSAVAEAGRAAQRASHRDG